MNCPRCTVGLKNVYTPKGILVDYCPDCQGIWFDRGELFYYSGAPEKITAALAEGLRNEKPSEADCPRCAAKLAEGGLFSDDLVIDRCPSCEGIWLDPSELSALVAAEGSPDGRPGMLAALSAPKGALAELGVAGGDSGDDGEPAPRRRRPFAAGELPRLPNLLLRSVGTFVVLYGLVGVLMIVLFEAGVFPLEVAVMITLASIVINYTISPFLLDLTVSWMMRGRWVAPEELPDHLAKFVAALSAREGIRFRWFGIIDDGTPNAFTYGHVPGNARIVITTGLMRRLSPVELEAVVAHEIGHAVHWDILVMTMASCVPILLYYIFRATADSLKHGGGKKEKDPRAAIMIVSYLAYVISQYVVLYLSRTREYWADRYAAQATGEPNALSRALIKIAYGLAADDGVPESRREEVTARRERMRAFAPLGIFDATSARGLVATSMRGRADKVLQGDGENFSRDSVTGAMQWDLWNPWAMYYELHSTHPLPAKRIEALSQTAEAMGQKPFVTFDAVQPESYWDEFAVDVAIHFLPTAAFLITLGATAAAGLEGASMGFALVAFGLASLVQLWFSYPSAGWPARSIASLLKVIKVSRVRPVPAELSGRILGKGIPGHILSEDLTLDDGTGYIFMDYQQPLAIFNWIFGLRNERFIGTQVTARGWYRRAPVPYFELLELDTHEGTKVCWAPFMKRVTAVLAVIVGLLIALG